MVTRERQLAVTFIQLADTLVSDYDLLSFLDLLVERSMAVVDADAGGVLLSDGNGKLKPLVSSDERMHQGTAYATDVVIRRLEDLQNAAAEGPCLDAYNLGRPVLEPDLAGSGVRRWPLLAAAAVQAGMRSVFGFPLQLDDVRVGALDLYRDRPGTFSEEHVHDARLLAAMATREVLRMQADAPPGSLPARMPDLSGDRAAIEQATGMTSAQLDVTVPRPRSACTPSPKNRTERLRPWPERSSPGRRASTGHRRLRHGDEHP